MKTELAKIAEQQHLAYDSHVKVMWGDYKSYKIAVKEDVHNWRYDFNIPLKASEYSDTGRMDGFIQSLLEDKKLIKKASYENYSLRIEAIMSRRAKSNLNNLIDVLDRVIGFAQNNAYDTCCEICGELTNTSVHAINENTFLGCDDCYNKIITNLDEIKASVKSKKGNFITGLVGAIIGSLIGAALWVAVYALGYIATICGIVLAVCVIKGFELFGGKLNKLGICFTVILTIAMVYASTYIAYGYTIYDIFKDTDNIDIFTAIRSVTYFMKDYPEFSSSFYKDLVVGYIFTAIGTVSTFYTAYQHSNARYTTRKLG